MENASKALIIAGAILLSILIIALGIYVFNMARGVSDSTALDEAEVNTFNSQFTNYRGKKMGSAVGELIDKAVSSAIQNKGDAQRLPDIVYNFDTVATSTNTTQLASKAVDTESANINKMNELRRKLANRHYYYVDFAFDEVSGVIKAIVITYDEAQLTSAIAIAENVKVE